MKTKPPPDSIERTKELLGKLVTVPKDELAAAERKWQRKKGQGLGRSTSRQTR